MRTSQSCWPVADLNLTTSSAGIRPRSFTSMPCALAHSRTSVVFRPLAEALRPARPCHRVPQRLGMLRIQVDLILRAIQPEANRPFSITTVNVVDVQGLYLLSHG